MAWLGYRGCRQGASPPSETNCYPATATPSSNPYPTSWHCRGHWAREVLGCGGQQRRLRLAGGQGQLDQVYLEEEQAFWNKIRLEQGQRIRAASCMCQKHSAAPPH